MKYPGNHIYRDILDTVPNPIFEVDPKMVISLANKEALKWWPHIVEGKSRTYEILLRAGKNDQKEDIVKDTFVSRQPQTGEIETKEGEFFHIKTNYTDKPEPMVLVHILDITGRKWAERSLRKSEAQYRLLFDSAPDGVTILNTRGDIVVCSRTAACLYGYSREEMIGNPFIDFVHADSVPLYKQKLSQLSRLQPTEGEINVVRKDGSIVNIWRKDVPLHDAGFFSGILCYDRDITEREKNREELRKYREQLENLVSERTARLEEANRELQKEIEERKRAQEELIKRETRYRTLFDLSPAGIVLEDTKGYIIDANPAFFDSFGYTKDEIIGEHVNILTHPDMVHKVKQNIDALQEGKILKHTEKSIKKDGTTCYMNLNEKMISLPDGRDGIICIVEDITERRQMEEQIKNSLQEKEVLLKEIHHRVKNNLQIISSLLSLQAGYIEDPKILDIFKNSCERIRTMALVHDELYRSQDLSKINFKEYINRLITHLFNSYSLTPGQVEQDIQIEQIVLDIQTAVPLSLIINELVSNCLKHAFPDRQEGTLKITLGADDHPEYDYMLIVSDNGVGLPESVKLHDAETLGIVLVTTLVKQLHGTLELDTQSGTKYIIRFRQLKHKGLK